MAPLGLISAGETVEIVDITMRKGKSLCKDKNVSCHTQDMGLRVGKVVEILNNEGSGPLLLKVDDSRIAIGRGIAMRIIARRIQ